MGEKSETPNVKKRHRRIKSSGLKNNDNDGMQCLSIRTCTIAD